MRIAIELEQMGYLTCKLTKAKASKSKDAPERSGSGRQLKEPWQKGLEVYGLEKEKQAWHLTTSSQQAEGPPEQTQEVPGKTSSEQHRSTDEVRNVGPGC